MIFFISDLHFGHKRICELTNRPFSSLDEMHAHLIKSWNSVVKENDLVYNLGDFCFSNTTTMRQIMASLHGRKILIRGNHDKHSVSSYIDAGFIAVFDQAKLCLTTSHSVNLSHYPYHPTEEELKDFEERNIDIRHLDRRLINNGEWLIHGHTHNNTPKVSGKSINVSCEVLNFKPISMPEIISIIDRTNNELLTQKT